MVKYMLTEVETITEVDWHSDEPPVKMVSVHSTAPQVLKWCLAEFQRMARKDPKNLFVTTLASRGVVDCHKVSNFIVRGAGRIEAKISNVFDEGLYWIVISHLCEEGWELFNTDLYRTNWREGGTVRRKYYFRRRVEE